MPRGYRRSGSGRRASLYSRSRATRSRYSIETTVRGVKLHDIPVGSNSGQPIDGSLVGQFEVVPSSSVQGMRKVKHMQVTVTLSHSGGSSESSGAISSAEVASLAAGCPIVWAMVYVPAGFLSDTNQQLQPLNLTGSLYEPNQFVICSGIADPNAGPIRINTPLARNLNSGDAIYLAWRIINGQGIRAADPEACLFSMCRYAITLS